MGLLILARVSKLSFSVDGEKFGSVWANCRLDFFSNSICVILRNMKNYSKGFFIINVDSTINNYSWTIINAF